VADARRAVQAAEREPVRELRACNKPCNKIGKFSLIQPHLKSEKTCKTTGN
jgi:hypothetical protein